MKRTISLFLVIILCLGLVGCTQTPTSGQSESQSEVTEEPTVALRTIKDDELIAAVQQGDLWGFIDTTGEWVIKPQFESAENFSEGYAAVSINGKYGYIDKTGIFIIKPTLSSAESFFNGYACVLKDGTLQYIDKSGGVKFEVGANNDTADYHEGWVSGGAMSNNGYVICEYIEPILNSQGGLESQNFYYSIFDKDGNIILPKKKNSEISFATDSIIYVTNWETHEQTFYDLEGNETTPNFMTELMSNTDYNFKYYIAGFYDGLAGVETTDGAWGYIDTAGNVVIKPDANRTYLQMLLSEGLMPFFNAEDSASWGYADKVGNIIIDAQFNAANCKPFSDGIASVQLWKGWEERTYPYYINIKGEVVIDLNKNATSDLWYECNSFNNGYAVVIKYDFQGKTEGEASDPAYGYINTSGEFIAECRFDNAKDFAYVNYKPEPKPEILIEASPPAATTIPTQTNDPEAAPGTTPIAAAAGTPTPKPTLTETPRPGIPESTPKPISNPILEFKDSPTHTTDNRPYFSGTIKDGLSGELTVNGEIIQTYYTWDVNQKVKWGFQPTVLEGENTFIFVFTNSEGKSTSVTKTIVYEMPAPIITFINCPTDTTEDTIWVTGKIQDGFSGELTMNGEYVTNYYGVDIGEEKSWGATARLVAGGNAFTFVFTNSKGKSTTITKTIIYTPV